MKLYHSSLFLIVWLLNVYLITSADAQPVLQASGLDQIQPLVEQAIQDQRMPGCVVVIGRHNAVLYQQAFGQRQLLPEQEPMTVETLFDLASLTKPIATATSIHLLQQRGKLSFDDPVVKYLPEFGVNGKDSITIRQLLTHTSGLLPDNSLK
ncbi:MAG: beta-lactamase family protein, partial [Planctomycetaceae bacterium]|nr:beta-lactamase family protein [Planctomycetaceae bacterium]